MFKKYTNHLHWNGIWWGLPIFLGQFYWCKFEVRFFTCLMASPYCTNCFLFVFCSVAGSIVYSYYSFKEKKTKHTQHKPIANTKDSENV